ncbi:MAG: tRNA dihydrouridine synthase DusB [Dethiobacter sp.]|jgi:tRNA-dihydrouridine synthase B|nr:tRNA dihydrouridine synthase DusB [Dethiobacter sp.]
MKIGSIFLKNRVILAPMAGVTDSSFRQLAKEMGAALVYSEMISAKGAICAPEHALKLACFGDKERPFGIQLFGSDPQTMARGAEMVAVFAPDLIDINMGCPVKKVVSKGEGCALMRDPEQAFRIARAVCDAVSIPITVKMRKGWDESAVNALEVALAVQEAGAAAVTVHGRTRAQGYSGSADWEIIKRVKDNLTIPVIGNGDIRQPNDAARMIDETGCDAIMLARGVLGNLWLIRETVHFLQTKELLPEADIYGRVALALRHLEMTVADKGEYTGIREMRKHVAWYLRGIRGAARIRDKVMQAKTSMEMEHVLKSLIT